MNNQKKHWNKIFEKYNSSSPSLFSEEAIENLNDNSYVLELGCGAGNDSIAFAGAGHKITATDFSEIAIYKNKDRFKDQENINFEVLDISHPMPFANAQFDAVYSRLSLHYFTAVTTKEIFSEINRILKPKGLLLFICKSIEDPLYGKGEVIEKDIFEFNGHVRHFFSEEFTRENMAGLFKIIKLEKGTDNFYDSKSAYIKVIASKL